MNYQVVNQPRHLVKQADAVIDFGNGKTVEFQINTKGCKNNDEKRTLEFNAISILQALSNKALSGKKQSEKRLGFVSSGICFNFYRNDGDNIIAHEVCGALEISICRAMFKDGKLHTYKINDKFFGLLNHFYGMLVDDKEINKIDQVRMAKIRINNRAKEQFGLKQDIIDYNGRTKIISVNKTLFNIETD